MNKLQSTLCNIEHEATLKLQHAILIYGGSSHAGGYATVHDVDTESDQPQILAGTPVTRNAIVSLMGSLSASESFGFLPENVLAVGKEYLVWWSKPQKRNVWFNSAEPLGARCGVTPHPALVFTVVGRKWSVYALKDDTRPTADTLLFQAPYFNVWEGGQICTGNANVPSMSSVERIAAYEAAFFGSYFTHPNIRAKGKLTRFRGGPYALWLSLLKRPRRRFPVNSLVPINRTAGDLVSSVTKAQELN